MSNVSEIQGKEISRPERVKYEICMLPRTIKLYVSHINWLLSVLPYGFLINNDFNPFLLSVWVV